MLFTSNPAGKKNKKNKAKWGRGHKETGETGGKSYGRSELLQWRLLFWFSKALAIAENAWHHHIAWPITQQHPWQDVQRNLCKMSRRYFSGKKKEKQWAQYSGWLPENPAQMLLSSCSSCANRLVSAVKTKQRWAAGFKPAWNCCWHKAAAGLNLKSGWNYTNWPRSWLQGGDSN